MANKRFVTMQDVANLVGLTKATVSLALRHHPSIPKTTRARVAKAARKLGYRPNPLVSALMSCHMQIRDNGPRLTLAYVTSHPKTDPWRSYDAYVRMFEGAKKRATELGSTVEEFSLAEHGMTPARLRTILNARGIRGVLAGPLPGDTTLFSIDIENLAVVGLGMSVIEPAIMRVACDLYHLTRLAVHRCADLGYRRIGFAVSAEMSSRLEHRLLAGYRQGLFDLGWGEAIAPLLPPQTATFASHLREWCRRERPEVIIFGTFDEACQRAVPVEIGCVATCVMHPGSPLTGTFQNERLVGAIAIEQLLNQLYHNATGPLEEPRAYLLRGQWNAGQTAPGPNRKRPLVVHEKAPA